MSDVPERRLHGIAVYNPDLLSKQELVAQFVARRELFAELVADLRRPKLTQHQLLVGHRGMGKTTLLRRLRYVVEDDPELSERWIALAFPEEQYNVGRLSDFYLNCIDALSDALERTGRRSEADALDEARESLPDTDEAHRAAAALDLLFGTARKLQRRLLLLVDNLNLILDRLETDQWAIRELLSRESRLLLIGATPFVIGATYSYDAAFYDFFRVHELQGLSFEETSEVLATLAREMDAPDVERLVREEPARIRTLHVLAGGNPRTIVLLFSVLAQGTEGDVRSDLEKLLDQTTPLYKARFEALAPQSQQVVDALAIHWDPISASELADKLRLDVNIVSSQLNRLAQQGVVEKVPYDPSSKTGFQIAERFFNIWYLMRASRRVRRRLTWLVQFLRLFYGLDQLQLKARDLLRSSSEAMPLRQAELCLAIAEALEQDRPMQLALETRAIKAMLATDELRKEIRNLFDLDGADAGFRPIIDRQTWAREYQAILDTAPDPETAELLRLIATDLRFSPQQRLTAAGRIQEINVDRRTQLRLSLSKGRAIRQEMLGPHLLRQVEAAILAGYIIDLDDKEAFSAASSALASPELELLLADRLLSPEKLTEIIRVSDEPLAWAMYAFTLADEGRIADTEDAVNKVAINDAGWFARLLVARAEIALGRHVSATAALKNVPLHVPLKFLLLAEAYEATGELEQSLVTVREGLALFPENPSLLGQYGRLLAADNRHSEAQKIFEKLIEVDPTDARAWGSLARTLTQQHEFSDALKIVEEALQQHLSARLRLMQAAILLLLDRPADALRSFHTCIVDDRNRDVTHIAILVAEQFVSVLSWEEMLSVLRILLPRVILEWNEPGINESSIQLFAAASRQGYASPAATLLEELHLQEPLRPIFEALRIHAAGNRDALNRLAPELRDPVVQLLDAWQEDTGEPAPPPKKKRKPTTTRKRNRRPR